MLHTTKTINLILDTSVKVLHVGREVVTAVAKKSAVFWDIMLPGPLKFN
jgi:hypothetical protein